MRVVEGGYNISVGLDGLDALRGEFPMTIDDHEHGYFISVDPLTRKNEYAASCANSCECAGVDVKYKAIGWF